MADFVIAQQTPTGEWEAIATIRGKKVGEGQEAIAEGAGGREGVFVALRLDDAPVAEGKPSVALSELDEIPAAEPAEPGIPET